LLANIKIAIALSSKDMSFLCVDKSFMGNTLQLD
jgi:hypothetical protein